MYAPPEAPSPTVIEPKAVVLKKCAGHSGKYRDITDAWKGNKSLEPWAVIYFTARDLAQAGRCAPPSGHRLGSRCQGWVPHLALLRVHW